MKIETLAQLKRIPVGTTLRLVHCLTGPVPARKQLRTVEKVRATQIVMKPAHAMGMSYLYFPKAAEFRATPGGFTIYEGAEIAAQYEIVEEGA